MGQKRARPPSSSLDIRTEGGDKKTTPPKLVQSSNDGSALDQEAVMKALYENPELVGMAHAAKAKGAEPKIPAKAEQKAYPQHLKAMMEEGVPVKQWIILLVLLGAGVYQLRKALVGPALSAAAAPTKGGKVSTKGKAKGKKAGKGSTRSVRNVVDKEKAPTIDGIEWNNIVVVKNEQVVKKKATSNARVKKASKKVASPPIKEAPDSPDSISTDGSSSTDGGVSPGKNGVAPLNEFPVVESSLDVDVNVSSPTEEGWLPVSKDKLAAHALPEKLEVVKISTQPEAPYVDAEPVLSELQVTPLVVHEMVEPPVVPDELPPALKSRKTKAKKVTKQVVKEKAAEGFETKKINAISDEDLALMLHEEEERIALFEKEKARKQDIWEDVVVPKRKNKAAKVLIDSS